MILTILFVECEPSQIERLEYKSDQLKSFSDLFQTRFGGKIRPFSDQITSENIEIRTSSISMYYKKIFFAVCLMEKIFCYALNKGKMPKFRLLKLFQTFFGLTLDEKSEFRRLPKKRTILSALGKSLEGALGLDDYNFFLKL